jgi:DNA-binding MarR family transcriptional regulator
MGSNAQQQLDPGTSLGYQVRRCHRRFDRLLNAYLAPHGLGSGFWYYLRVLWQRDGLTQRALSDEVNVAENSTVVTINAMAERALVNRVRDAVDRRKIRITLTEEGRALEDRLMPHALRINDVATDGIDPADVATCLEVLKRVADNLERELEAA